MEKASGISSLPSIALIYYSDTADMHGMYHRLFGIAASFDHHRSPGRFFAESEAKAILAHILMTYDIEMPTGRPSNLYFGEAVLCDTNAEMLFRKRTGTVASTA